MKTNTAKIQRPNAIERKEGMSCLSCEIAPKCKYVKGFQPSQKERQICRYYCNSEKGCFDNSGVKKVT